MFSDPFDHERHIGYLRMKSQAKYRNEAWDLTMEDFFKIWKDPEVWNNRGRDSDSWALTRKNVHKPWSLKNVQLMRRSDQLNLSKQRTYARRHGLKYV